MLTFHFRFICAVIVNVYMYVFIFQICTKMALALLDFIWAVRFHTQQYVTRTSMSRARVRHLHEYVTRTSRLRALVRPSANQHVIALTCVYVMRVPCFGQQINHNPAGGRVA